MDEQKTQTIFDPAKVIAIGIASPAATLLTSRFGIAGTLLGLALGAMILTAVADFLKVYLARTSHAAATIAPEAMKAPRDLPTAFFGERVVPGQRPRTAGSPRPRPAGGGGGPFWWAGASLPRGSHSFGPGCRNGPRA